MKKNYSLTSFDYKRILFIILSFFLNSFLFGQTTTTFTASGSWICPAGVTSIQVQAWGAGGAGGNGGSSNRNAGGGGGGGGYSRLTSVAVTPNTTYTITVGTGGTNSLTVGGNGGNGQASTATFGATTITANGGSGGFGFSNGSTGGLGGSGNVSTGGIGALGNSVSGIAGGGGEGAATTGNGTNATSCNGGTGTNGGDGATYGNCSGGNSGGGVSATTASGYGGGGSGSVKNFAAGSGASGAISITYTCPTQTTNAGPDQNLTACSTTATLAATPATYGTGTWSIISGTATITSPNSPTSGITGIVPGTPVTLRWTISNGTCGATTDDVIITSPIGSGCLTYCTPSISATYQPPTNHHIRKVEFIGTLLDVVNTSTYSTVTPYGYQDFTGLATKSQQAQGEGVNIYFESPSSGYMKAWVDWNRDGDFADAGETVYNSGGVSQASTTLGFIIPGGTPVGDYRVRLRISGRNGSGSDAGSSWDSCSTNLAYYGETEDYLFTVIASCNAKITSITNGTRCGSGSVTLNATASAGTTEYRWYANQTGGTQLAGSPTATGAWNSPSISNTTTYWVTAYNGSCESLVRTKVTAIVKPVAALSFATTSPEICGEDDIIKLTASGSTEVVNLIDETFESGSLGSFTAITSVAPASGTVSTASAWQNHTSPYIPTGTTWFPAISSGLNPNKFAFVSSDVGTCGASCYYTIENSLTSSTVNTSTFTDLTLEFKLFFDRYYPDGANPATEYMAVEVSTDGTTWTNISGNITSDQGYGTKFKQMSYNLNSYVNNPSVSIRIRYYTSTWANGAAVDEIQLYGSRPLAPNFTWTGSPVAAFTDAACTIPYTSGTTLSTPDIWIKPTLAQLETGSYSFTANANLANGCTTSATINVTNKSKVWKGTTNNDWNTASNWLPVGVPTANDCVIISTGTTSQIMNTPNALAKNLKVKGTGNLELQSERNLTVTDWINVESGATFNVRNSANLVQVTESPVPANSGIINMQRTAFVDSKDYVYWSSPVAGFNSANISLTSSNNHLYKWLPTTGGVNGFGNWTSGVETMVIGQGYIERGLNSAPLNSPVNFTSTFIGTPNNGTISTPISRGTYSGIDYTTGLSATPATDDDDNWNLLGNPYPSSISAADFLNANSTNLDGFVKIWTHGIPPQTTAQDPYYNNYGYNYDPNDYITWNLSGPSSPGYSGYISAGQGFLTKMKHTSPTTSSTAVFNNSMRNASFTNSEFYKSANQKTSIDNSEGRIWIDLVSSNASTRALIAYVDGATNNRDQMYDAQADLKTNFRINSLLGQERLIIQGKKAPFDSNDQVNLAFKTPTNGTYTIAIGAVDGLFTDLSQNIYLEDTQLNIIHDLRSAPYQFTTTQEENVNRFILRYTNQTLSNDTFDYNNTVSIYANENVTIKSTSENIKNIKIYDVLGKTLVDKDKVNKNEVILTELKPTGGMLIVKATLTNGSEVTKKVIF